MACKYRPIINCGLEKCECVMRLGEDDLTEYYYIPHTGEIWVSVYDEDNDEWNTYKIEDPESEGLMW